MGAAKEGSRAGIARQIQEQDSSSYGVYRLHRLEGVPIEELTAAVKTVFTDVDFAEAWREYIEEEDDE